MQSQVTPNTEIPVRTLHTAMCLAKDLANYEPTLLPGTFAEPTKLRVLKRTFLTHLGQLLAENLGRANASDGAAGGKSQPRLRADYIDIHLSVSFSEVKRMVTALGLEEGTIQRERMKCLTEMSENDMNSCYQMLRIAIKEYVAKKEALHDSSVHGDVRTASIDYTIHTTGKDSDGEQRKNTNEWLESRGLPTLPAIEEESDDSEQFRNNEVSIAIIDTLLTVLGSIAIGLKPSCTAERTVLQNLHHEIDRVKKNRTFSTAEFAKFFLACLKEQKVENTVITTVALLLKEEPLTKPFSRLVRTPCNKWLSSRRAHSIFSPNDKGS